MTNSNSNVTAIIPCYNDGGYIMQALKSLYNQTLLPEKIIIVDDGSNETTRNVLKKIEHASVQIVYQNNKGVSNARNTAISLAKTDYILNLDADDYYEPTFIEHALKILDNNTNVAAVCALVKILRGNKFEKEIKKPLGGVVKNFIVTNNGVSGSMFRKKCWIEVSGFDENMKNGYEDWEFWIAVLKQNWTMHIIQEPLFVYRIKKQSRDKTAVKDYDFELKKYIFTKHKDLYQKYFEFYCSELLRRNSLLKNKLLKVENSPEIKLGIILTKPLRFLKRLFK